MNIALIGFGEVGKSFVKLLQIKKHLLPKNIKLKYIIKSNGGIYNKEGLNIDEIVKYTSSNNSIEKYPLWSNITFKDILKNKDVDILIELTATNIINGQPGYTHIKSALENNINVITGNKGPILLYYNELKNIANKCDFILKLHWI